MVNWIKNQYNYIRIPSSYSLLALFFCYITMKPLLSDAGIGVCVCILILCFFSTQKMEKNLCILKESIVKFWQMIILVFFFFIFYYSLLGIAYLELDGKDGFIFDDSWYFLLSLFWTIPVYIHLFSASLVHLQKNNRIENRTGLSLRKKSVLIIVMLVNYSIWRYAFNPCITTSDTAMIYYWAHTIGKAPLSDSHPAFYTMAMGALLKICDSAVFLIYLQCFLFSLLVVQIIDYLLRMGARKGLMVALYISYGFIYSNVITVITLVKDIPYTMSLLWSSFLLFQYISEKGKVKTSWYVRLPISMVFIALFRHNGMLVSLLLLLALLFVFIKNRQYMGLVSLFGFCVAFFLIKGPIYSYFNVVPNEKLKYYSLANDVVGTYYSIGYSDDDVVQLVNDFTQGNPENFEYTPYYVYYKGAQLEGYSLPKFIGIYIKTFFNHPKALALNVLRRTTITWSIIKPIEQSQSINYTESVRVLDQEFEFKPYEKRVIREWTEFLNRVITSLSKNSIIYLLCWRTALYLILACILGVCQIIRHKWQVLLVFVPCLSNVLSLLIANGWTEYRYNWPTTILSLFIVAAIPYATFNASSDSGGSD